MAHTLHLKTEGLATGFAGRVEVWLLALQRYYMNTVRKGGAGMTYQRDDTVADALLLTIVDRGSVIVGPVVPDCNRVLQTHQ